MHLSFILCQIFFHFLSGLFVSGCKEHAFLRMCVRARVCVCVGGCSGGGGGV